MAAATAHKPPCEVVELSSDEDEPNVPIPSLKGKAIAPRSASQLPGLASNTSSLSNPVAARLHDDRIRHNLSDDDIFRFGYGVGVQPKIPGNRITQSSSPAPLLPLPGHPLSDRSTPAAAEETPMRQAAKRRKLNLPSDINPPMRGTSGDRSSSRPALETRLGPRSEATSTPGDDRPAEKNTKLKGLQAVLNFSDDDLFNFEVAVGGQENLLQHLEQTHAEQERNKSSRAWTRPNGRYSAEELIVEAPETLGSRRQERYRRSSAADETSKQAPAREPLRERSLNILGDLSERIPSQSGEKRKSRPQRTPWENSIAKGLGEVEEGEYMFLPKRPTVLDLSGLFDDGLDEPPLPLKVSPIGAGRTGTPRSSPRTRPREYNYDGPYRVAAASLQGRDKPSTALGKRRVSIVSLESGPTYSISSPKATNASKLSSRSIWDANLDDQLDENTDPKDLEGDSSIEDDDRGVFTTSKAHAQALDTFDYDFDIPEEAVAEKQFGLSEHTSQLLAAITAKSKRKGRHKPFTEGVKGKLGTTLERSKLSRTASLQSAALDSLSDSQGLAKRPSGPKRPRLTSVEREQQKQAKERERAHKAEEKAKGKEEREDQKRLEKERKAREKQRAADLAEVNKARTNKKDSTPEMIVDLPKSIEGTSVHTQIAPFLADLNVESTTYDSPVPDVIKFRRKVTARWNDALGRKEPIPATVEPEKHILCLLSGPDFAHLASLERGLENHVARVARAYPGSQPIYLIEGIDALIRKSRNARNRAHVANVRNNMPGAQENGQGRRRRGGGPSTAADEIVDELTVEDGLLRLQVLHGVLVHQTAASVETARWVAVFTQHISTIPYKTQRGTQEANFCMDVGQVRCGEDKGDTYAKLLQTLTRITPAIALGIANEYPDVTSLVRAFRSGGPLILEDIMKGANRNGAVSDARIGPALSRRVYRVFMERDPGARDL